MQTPIAGADGGVHYAPSGGGGLSLRALAKHDADAMDFYMAGTQGDHDGHGGAVSEADGGGPRDLATEYLKVRKLDEAHRRRAQRLSSRRRGAAATSPRGRSEAASPEPVDPAARAASPPPEGWQKYYKVGDTFGPSPSPVASPRATTPHAAGRDVWRPRHPSGTADELGARPGTPRTNRSRPKTPMSLKSTEQLHWHQYRTRPVHERLRDTTHKERRMQSLRDTDRKAHANECPFEPALCIATVMGTFPGAKRRSAVRRNVRDVGTAPGASVRFVTINAPAAENDDMSDRTRSDIDVDDVPPPQAMRVLRQSPQNSTPHYMMPLAPPPPPAQPAKARITWMAKATPRRRRDLHEWAAERDDRLLEKQEAARSAEDQEVRGTPFEPAINEESQAIIGALGDRRLDVYARSEMDAAARRDAVRTDIARREVLQARDMKRQTAAKALEANASREARRITKEAKVDLAWFSSQVRSDKAYTLNRETD